MSYNNNGEIKDSSRKSNKGLTRRMKEADHFTKSSKSPKHRTLGVNTESRRSREKEVISKYMSGTISEDDCYDFDDR